MECAEKQPLGDSEQPIKFIDADQDDDCAPNQTSPSTSNLPQTVHCEIPLLVNDYCHPKISLPGLVLHDESASSSILSLRTKYMTNSWKENRYSLTSLDRQSLLSSALKDGRRLLRRLSSILPSPAICRAKAKGKLTKERRRIADDSFLKEYARNKLEEYQRVFDELYAAEQIGQDNASMIDEDYRMHHAVMMVGGKGQSKQSTTLEHLRSLERSEDDDLLHWNSRMWNRLTMDGFSSAGTIATLLWPAWVESQHFDSQEELQPFEDPPKWNAKGWHMVMRGSMMWSFDDPWPIYSIKWAMAGGDFQAQWIL